MPGTPATPHDSPTGAVALVAGPLYLDIVTAPTYPPESAFHVEYRPRGGRGWAAARAIGGSSLKFAIHWAQHCGDALFVSKVAPRGSAASTAPVGPFGVSDDGTWLLDALEQERLKTGERQFVLHTDVTRASGRAITDYAVHTEHPTRTPWPLFSFGGGAAGELGWGDVLASVQSHRDLVRRAGRFLVFIGGVLRTNVIETFDKDRKGLPDGTVLCVDFGRTDLRGDMHDGNEARPERIRDFVEQVDAAFLDHLTAERLGLLVDASRLPRRFLVVRPRSIMPGRWWVFRRAEKRGVIERAEIEAPQLESERTAKARAGRAAVGVDRIGRSIRVAQLCHDVVLTGRVQARWSSFRSLGNFRTPEDVTLDAGLQRELKRLVHRAEKDVGFSRLLIAGPTGSGKEIVAKFLHRTHPHRSSAPFVPVACAMLHGDLVDSHLFGHRKGAFTGAFEDRVGAFESVENGFLLIDDLDALPLTTQAKLLRVLEDNRITRVGDDDTRSKWVDPFVVVTTNVPPRQLVAEGRLRADLYYRFEASAVLEVPPLATRRADARRYAGQLWEELNGVWETGLPFPSELERWLSTARLGGNYRTVEAAVTRVHTLEREPQYNHGRGAAQLLRDAGLDGAAAMVPAAQSKAPVRMSADALRVARACKKAGIAASENLDTRMQCLVDAWARVAPNVALSRREIAHCLELESCSESGMQALLRRLAHSEAIPRVRGCGAGRGSRWEIVVT